MEITRSNFTQVLPQVEQAIKSATFLTIDCELTGLNTVTDLNSYDTLRTYYEKVRRNCKDFLVIQYGISAFRYDSESNAFKQQSFCFYIFRRPANRNVPDQRFLCQASSIDFLISQDFDFNKLFKEGISYLNIEEESKYKTNLEEAQKNRANAIISQQNGNDNKIPIPESDQPFIDKVVTQIEEFIKSDEKEIQLPKSNAFIRRLIYQTAAEKFGNTVSLETKKVDNDRILIVGRAKSNEEKKLEEENKYNEHLKELDEAVGFSKVLRLIVDSGKLIVGHNLCLDILHTIDKFLTPLPHDYQEFKTCAHSLFTNILDTKYMANSEPFKDLIQSNVLGHLLETVLKKPFKLPAIETEDERVGYTLEDKKEHEAGYDAFITGVSFLSMWKYLGICKNLPDKETFANYNLLRPYLNKIFLLKLQDNPYIYLGGKDPTPSREHVFHLAFPKNWKTNDIVQLFSPFGNIHVAWISESSAYVGLYRKDQAAVALSTLSQSDTYTISTFARYQAHILGSRTPFSSPQSRKKRPADTLQSENKKRRTNSFGESSYSKRSIEPIAEEEQEAEDCEDNHQTGDTGTLMFDNKQGSAKKGGKAFQESNEWE